MKFFLAPLGIMALAALVDVVVFYRVASSYCFTYGIDRCEAGIENLVATALRDIMRSVLTSESAAGNCRPISECGMQPGDIPWKTGRVAIYIGGDQYIHAPQPGDVVKVSSGASGCFTHYLVFA